MMESTYSVSSFSGLVSSKRRLVCPPNSSARPKSRQIAFACPMCRYPFGSGGNLVCTRPPYLFVSRSRTMMSRMKLDGFGASGAGFAPASLLGFAAFIFTLFYRGATKGACRGHETRLRIRALCAMRYQWLNGTRFGTHRRGDVIGVIGKRLARSVGSFFVLAACPANRVVPAVVPRDSSLAVHNYPLTVNTAERLARSPVPIQGDHEGAEGPSAHSHFPFPEKASLTGSADRLFRRVELDTGNIGHGERLLCAVFKDDHNGILRRCRPGVHYG